MVVTQTERSVIMKKILEWLNTQKNGATNPAISYYVKWEITEGGATDNAIKKYVKDLHKAGHIKYDHPFWKITPTGKEWLERHSI